ncbi:hypothetical protein EV198_3158 [Roseivirga ehrenbergii]|uniref:DUF6249 domain-containing protein n=1 Tax=Roseivirga ehrenbergii (strain DSM 102268 / JCM 13514 / KCTC 12282 / NCIMB 14502 / KMM 6017) TaxID=279360 RepID=A0A150XCA0_ROSEK|nr:DUF6249 domain-containing protein [Roseivirga ehrenbergii]KYG76322.1 hypothetical protein MB14_03490 [Roseivirga ehrenbergii]TCL00142.1 hypothetical protein EV198_3158 [Roseivirga ehrenbergii]
MNEIVGIFFIIAILSIAGLIFFHLLTRHRERAMLIEKGADASLFQTEPKKRNLFFTIILGSLLVCLSLGIGLGYVLDNLLTNMSESNVQFDRYRSNDHPGAYFFTIFLMLGVGFISSFFLHRKLILEKKN